MVMNCVNLRSMYPAKWLNSLRWMGHRSCKVRPQTCRTAEDKGRTVLVFYLCHFFPSIRLVNTHLFKLLLKQLVD